MAILVWSNDQEWNGSPVKAGDVIPKMERRDRVALYVSKKAVRQEDFKSSPIPPVDDADLES